MTWYSTYVYGKEAVGSVGLGRTFATNTTTGYDPRKPSGVELIYKPLGQVGTDLFNEVASIAWKAWWAGVILRYVARQDPQWRIQAVICCRNISGPSRGRFSLEFWHGSVRQSRKSGQKKND